MEQYLKDIPYFLIAVALGIIPGLLRSARLHKAKGEKFPAVRYVEEGFSGLWISVVAAGLLDYYTDFSLFAICAVSTVAAFFNSILIDYIGNELIIFVVKKVKDKLLKLVK